MPEALITSVFFPDLYTTFPVERTEIALPPTELILREAALALTDTLDNGTPIGRAMAKRAAQSIVEKIVNAIAQESHIATSDNS